jgi:hypothetical protein
VSDIRNEHYAITWYRLAAVLIVIGGLRGRSRQGEIGANPPYTQQSLRVDLLGEPHLDERLVGHVAFVRGNPDALQQGYWQSQRD